MILPLKWIIRRPGFLIPVFFLSCFQIAGQVHWQDAESAALGRCYVTRLGTSCAGLNQAALGRIDKSSCSLHHLRPFITPELDILTLSLQLSLKRGGPGLSLSTMGITGMRQTSAWISYGLMLHPRLYAGAGIHLLNTGIREDALFHTEAGFALGLQFMVSDELILGAHVKHPKTWAGSKSGPADEHPVISTGFSYSFYKTALLHTELNVTAGLPIQWCNGLAIKISDSLQLLLGINNQPWSLSAGLSLKHKSWGINLAGTFCMDSGATPATSLAYAW
ncbi:MAG: hypothetical protein GY790_12990 [Bacteroidetes bacterium]|nr:hypothetical protein [Bacteroidota bacterium]